MGPGHSEFRLTNRYTWSNFSNNYEFRLTGAMQAVVATLAVAPRLAPADAAAWQEGPSTWMSLVTKCRLWLVDKLSLAAQILARFRGGDPEREGVKRCLCLCVADSCFDLFSRRFNQIPYAFEGATSKASTMRISAERLLAQQSDLATSGALLGLRCSNGPHRHAVSSRIIYMGI